MQTPLPKLAFSISEFCQMVGVSRGFYYSLPESARPRFVKRGARTLISADAIGEWLSTEFPNRKGSADV